MQGIYAFNKSKVSNYQLAIDNIKNIYKTEISIYGAVEKDRINNEKEISIEYFKNQNDENLDNSNASVIKAKKIALTYISDYHKKVDEEFRDTRKKLLQEVESLVIRYIRFLKLLVGFANISAQEAEKYDSSKIKLHENLLLKNLKKNRELSVHIHENNFGIEVSKLKLWFKTLKNNEFLLEYYSKNNHTFEEDKEIVRHIIRDFLFKHNLVVSHFGDIDLKWSENKLILRNMVVKTIKDLTEDNFEDLELLTISRNWEDDKWFFETLYNETIHNDEEYEELIALKSKRWAAERIAETDKILLKMAITEMYQFSSIPVKVSINEYIEISKSYSTPKSWQFINGMLDVISTQLEKDGKIRKSGRGLIDNK